MNSHPSDARAPIDPAAELIAKGQAFEESGQPLEGIRCYSEAVQVYGTADAYRSLIRAQNDSGRYQEAFQSCKRAVRLFPLEAPFYVTLAGLYRRFGMHKAARDLLGTAAAKFPDDAEIAIKLAASQFQTGRFAEAIPMLERAIALKPSAEAYRGLAKVKTRIDDAEGARRALLEGRDRFPLDVGLANACGQFDPAAAARSREAMRAALPALESEPTAQSEILRYLTRAQAEDWRLAAGLSVNRASNWADLVRWSDPGGMTAFIAALERELKGAAPRGEALIERAAAAVAQMDWVDAERWFARVRSHPSQTVADVSVFDLEFLASLEKRADSEIWSPFPPIREIVTSTAWPAATIYVACDPSFLDLYIPGFLDSFASFGAPAGIHIHLMDGTEAEWRRAAQMLGRWNGISMSMTAESWARQNLGPSARNYYHAARYVRFHQYLAQNARPAWILDVDSIFEASPAPLFSLLDEHDFAATTSAVSLEPWAKIRAGLVGIAPTAAGKSYIRLVAAYISYWFAKNSLRWGIDQQALFSAYFFLESCARAPKTCFLGEEFMNDREGVPCIVRPVLDAARWQKGAALAASLRSRDDPDDRGDDQCIV